MAMVGFLKCIVIVFVVFMMTWFCTIPSVRLIQDVPKQAVVGESIASGDALSIIINTLPVVRGVLKFHESPIRLARSKELQGDVSP